MGTSRQDSNETLQTPDTGKHLVILMPPGRRGYIEHGRPVLEAARELGVEIESICAGRLTCGKCKIRVEEGNFQKHGIISKSAHLSEPSREELLLLRQMGGRVARTIGTELRPIAILAVAYREGTKTSIRKLSAMR